MNHGTINHIPSVRGSNLSTISIDSQAVPDTDVLDVTKRFAETA